MKLCCVFLIQTLIPLIYAGGKGGDGGDTIIMTDGGGGGGGCCHEQSHPIPIPIPMYRPQRPHHEVVVIPIHTQSFHGHHQHVVEEHGWAPSWKGQFLQGLKGGLHGGFHQGLYRGFHGHGF